jgi:hypothetical protein
MAHVFPVAHIEQHGSTSGNGGEQANDEVRVAQVLADATRKHKLDLRKVESKGFGVGERLQCGLRVLASQIDCMWATASEV